MGLYVSMNSIAKPISKIMIGDNNNSAKQTYRGYIGVDNKSQLFIYDNVYASNKLYVPDKITDEWLANNQYNGTSKHFFIFSGNSTQGWVLNTNYGISQIEVPDQYVLWENASSAVTNDIFFRIGGQNRYSETVDTAYAYDTNLTMHELTPISRKLYSISGADTEKYAIFAGGRSSDNKVVSSSVYAFDHSMSMLSAPDIHRAYNIPCGQLKQYSIFMGGAPRADHISVIDQSLTKVYDSNLPWYLNRCPSGVVGDRLVFAGGNFQGYTWSDEIITCDESLTYSIAKTKLIYEVGSSAGFSVDNKYMCIAGGESKTGDVSHSQSIQYIDDNLTVNESFDTLPWDFSGTCRAIGGKFNNHGIFLSHRFSTVLIVDCR